MCRWTMIAWAVALVTLAGPAVAQDDGDVGDGALPSCIEVSGEARFRGYAYDHIVIVTNGCDERARCEVWTNVTPERRPVTVEAGRRQEVVTRVGSPARELTPHARCELD
jgi:hypothetical protein